MHWLYRLAALFPDTGAYCRGWLQRACRATKPLLVTWMPFSSKGEMLQEVGAPWQPATDECSDCHSHAFITAPDAPVNPILYWVGRREGDTFAIGQAKGPYRHALCKTAGLILLR